MSRDQGGSIDLKLGNICFQSSENTTTTTRTQRASTAPYRHRPQGGSLIRSRNSDKSPHSDNNTTTTRQQQDNKTLKFCRQRIHATGPSASIRIVVLILNWSPCGPHGSHVVPMRSHEVPMMSPWSPNNGVEEDQVKAGLTNHTSPQHATRQYDACRFAAFCWLPPWPRWHVAEFVLFDRICCAPEGTKRGPKGSQRGPKTDPRRPKGIHGGPKETQGIPKEPKGGTQGDPRETQEGPKGTQKDPRGSKRRPKGTKSRAKSATPTHGPTKKNQKASKVCNCQQKQAPSTKKHQKNRRHNETRRHRSTKPEFRTN